MARSSKASSRSKVKKTPLARKGGKAGDAKKSGKSGTARTASKTPAPAKKPRKRADAPASQKPTTGKGKAATPGKRKAKAKAASSVETTAASEADEILARLQFLSHVDDDAGREVAELVARLETTATEACLPAMFGMLASDDPHGIQWSVFFIMEGFDDAYLEGLLDALPDLYERAGVWAETAVIRILNTRGHDDDCVASFEHLARKRPKTVRRVLVRLLDGVLDDPAGDLLPDQRRTISATRKHLGES